MNGERVKHTVSDDAQQDRTHPVFYSLQEEWEKCVQTIQNRPPRNALVKTQGRRLRLIRTIQVQDRACSEEQLEKLKACLAQKDGIPNTYMQQAPDHRRNVGGVKEIPVFWEAI